MRYFIFSLLLFFLITSPVITFNISQAAQPKEKKTLRIYSDRSFARDWTETGHPIKRAFEFECNCNVEFVTINGANNIIYRLILEGTSAKADLVVSLDSNFIDRASDTRLFSAINPKIASLVLNYKWQDPYFIPYNYGYLAFVYDSTKLKNPPKSFAELIERKDLKILIQDPRSSSPSLGLVAWIRSIYQDQTPVIWHQLKDKIVTITKSWSESYSLFLRGEADMVLAYTTSPVYHIIAERNDNIKAAYFSEGHLIQYQYIGKLKNSKEPELADMFLKFVLSKQFQSLIPVSNFMYPVIELGPDLPAEYRKLEVPAKILSISSDEMKNKRDLWIKEWLQALSKN